MNFDFTEAEKGLFAKIRAIADAAPTEGRLAADPPQAVARALQEAAGALTASGCFHSGAAGEAPDRAVTRMAAMETLAACSPSLFLAVAMSTRLLGRALAQWGAGPPQEAWLKRLLEGGAIGALALSEDAMNVENDPLKTQGIRQNGRIVLNGHKSYVINAPLADLIAVVGLLEDQPVIFLLERETPGLVISERLDTMGYNGLHIAGLHLKDCALPGENVICAPAGVGLLDQLRQWENEILTAAALGLMQASFQEARDFAKSHRSGGKPVIAYQEVGFKLSEMLTLQQTAQLLAYRAVWTLEHQPNDGASLLWCAKVFATEAAERVAGDALRILAGQGFRSGSAAESAFRAVKWTQIGGISTEIARVRIGDHALGYR